MNIGWLALAIIGQHWLDAKPTDSTAPTEAGDRMATILRISDETTRADMIEALGYLNAEAKAIRRKGYIGTASAAYVLAHGRIDALLEDLLATP